MCDKSGRKNSQTKKRPMISDDQSKKVFRELGVFGLPGTPGNGLEEKICELCEIWASGLE